MNRKLILAAIAGLAVIVATLWFLSQRQQGDHELAGLVGGPFALVSAETGQPVTEKSWPGQYLLIYFGYTYCPDVCPTTLAQMAAALKAIGPKAEKIQPLFITIDPERDTPDLMKVYVAGFDPRLIGLTGTPAQIAAVEKAYRVLASKQGDGEGYQMQHSSLVYLIGPDGRLKSLFAPDVTTEKMAEALGKL